MALEIKRQAIDIHRPDDDFQVENADHPDDSLRQAFACGGGEIVPHSRVVAPRLMPYRNHFVARL